MMWGMGNLRRTFRWAGLAVGVSILAACAPAGGGSTPSTVTFDDYEKAMLRAVACLNERVPDAWAALGGLVDRGQNYTVTYRALADVDVDEAWEDCHDEYAATIESAWQTQNARSWENDLVWMVDEFRECAQRVLGTDSDSVDVVNTATQQMLDAPLSDAVEAFEQFNQTLGAVASSDPSKVFVLDCLDEAGFNNFGIG